MDMDRRVDRLMALLRLARRRGDRAAELILSSRLHALAWQIIGIVPKT